MDQISQDMIILLLNHNLQALLTDTDHQDILVVMQLLKSSKNLTSLTGKKISSTTGGAFFFFLWHSCNVKMTYFQLGVCRLGPKNVRNVTTAITIGIRFGDAWNLMQIEKVFMQICGE